MVIQKIKEDPVWRMWATVIGLVTPIAASLTWFENKIEEHIKAHEKHAIEQMNSYKKAIDSEHNSIKDRLKLIETFIFLHAPPRGEFKKEQDFIS